MQLAEITSFLADESQLSKKLPIVLGVSGGADSSCLLHILQKEGYWVIVAHLDHSLRPTSGEDAKFVQELAESYGCEMLLEKEAVGAIAEQEKHNLEAIARNIRYSFLFKLARERDAQAVLVAHHADDQAETILMRLIRGAGLRGLTAMEAVAQPNQWDENIPLLRPLLNVPKTEILDYCQKNSINYLEDPSNSDVRLLRNQVRHEVIPKLDAINPNFRQSLLRSAEVLRAENTELERLADIAWQKCIRQEANGPFVISKTRFNELPLAIKRRILMRVYSENLGSSEEISFSLIAEALAYIASASAHQQFEWTKGLHMLEENGSILVFQVGEMPPFSGPQMMSSEASSFTIPHHQQLKSGWRFEIKQISEQGDTLKGEYITNCTFNEIRQLELRPRKPGDRFQPKGMKQGSMKLSDFMINEKMVQRARKAWPLLASGNEILWVPGYRLSEKICVKDASAHITQISFVQTNQS